MKDQEESNVLSRRDGPKDTNRLSKIEINAMCIAQDMQMMKEKMDVMMNAIREQMSTNLDKLVQRTDSPFTVQVTSFPFPTKFQMPQMGTKWGYTFSEKF